MGVRETVPHAVVSANPNAGQPRALVVGWFSWENSDFTAGDILAADLVCEWLSEAGCDWDIAVVPPLTDGLELRSADSNAYDLAVFVCGPFMQNHWEAEFFERFSSCTTIGVNLTLPIPLAEWDPFDILFERDSNRKVNPDITFLSENPLVPVVGICLVEEYPPADVPTANAAIARLIQRNAVAAVPIDTRLDVNTTGLRTKAEIESMLARMDVVLTTRLHGTVLSLKNGVPVVAIDPEPGGAKIKLQAEALGWPLVFNVDELDDDRLQEALDYCLTPEARDRAEACSDRAKRSVAKVKGEFIAAVEGLSRGEAAND